MRLLLAICFFQFQRASSQFPEHTDFQKLGEVYYKDEMYNILKESTHSVRDHFRDFMQRRESEDFPTKKIFLDKNGFRHYWSGLYDSENFRKVGIDKRNVLELLKQNQAGIKSGTQIQYDEFKSKQAEIARHIRRKLNKVDKIIMKPILRNGKATVKTTKKAGGATTKPKTTKKAAAGATTKPKTTKKAVAAVTTKPNPKVADKPEAKVQKIIMTQFFCPYFGVMTLTSALD